MTTAKNRAIDHFRRGRVREEKHELLEDGAYEEAVVVPDVEGALDDPILDVLPVADDELVLVASPDLIGATPSRPTAAQLAALPWVFREKGSGTRAIFEAAAADIGFDPADLQVALTLPTNEAVRAAVEAGAGVAALSRLAVAKALKAGTLAAFPLALPKRRFFAVRHRERHVSAAEREFMRLIDAA